MKDDAELIEYVVREVIRRLTADGQRVDTTATAGGPVPIRQLQLTAPLITLATLQGKLDGVTHVTIARRSVVTPAVRDELKQRMIELKREE